MTHHMYCSWLDVHAWPTGTKREAACPPCCCESWHEIRTRLQLLPLTHHFWRRPDVANAHQLRGSCMWERFRRGGVAVDKTKCRKQRACPCETEQTSRPKNIKRLEKLTSASETRYKKIPVPVFASNFWLRSPVWVWFRFFLKT